jgi:hypothetical protein
VPGDAAESSPDQLSESSTDFDLEAIDATTPPSAGDPSKLDPLDPATYRQANTLVEAKGVTEVLTEITARSPDKEWWCRVHPDPANSLCTWVVELKSLQKENYLVLPPLWPSLVGEACFKRKSYHLAVTMQGLPFLWSVRQPADDTKEPDRWMVTALEAVRQAKTKWTRLCWDDGQKKHRLSVSQSDAVPRWPELSFKELIRLAFKDYAITSLDHPVLRQLRGEA